MAHLLAGSPAIPDVGPAPSAVDSTQRTPPPVLITEGEVAFNTAAAGYVRPATTRRHWPGTTLIAAVRHIHIALPEPRLHYPPRDPSYFEAARLSRQMDHL